MSRAARARRRPAATLLLTSASCAVALLLGEVVCALVAPSTRVTRDILGRRIFASEVVRIERRHGDARYADFAPGSGGRQRLLDDYDFSWRLNSAGVRGREPARLAPDTWRVLVLGDSQTFGWMADEQTFCGQLEVALQRAVRRPVVVWNAGVPGHGTFEESWRLERLAPLLRPHLVLVVVYADNALVPDEGNDLWNNRARLDAQAHAPPPGPVRAKSLFLADHSHLYALLSSARRKLFETPYVERVRRYREHEPQRRALAEVWDRTRDALRDMQRVARETCGARTVVVYLPGLASLEIGDASALTELRAAGPPVVSLFEPLQAARAGRSERLRFRLDGHYNPAAHAYIAAALQQALLAGGFGPPRDAPPPRG